MPFMAVIADLVAVGFYLLQVQTPTPAMFTMGIVVQALVTLLLLIFTFGYKGPHRLSFFRAGYVNFTFRYGIIAGSMVINALILFMYFLNITGRNTVIFGG